ncbi:MAG: hypothetical protein JSV74_06605 [Dehalococcoidia bacterium]|nr:MAG: hypothetical protein JSV74_06605 [Dehalococcoidia bacterium]
MKVTIDELATEFETFQARYLKAHERMVFMQEVMVEGIRKIGVGCIQEESRAEFVALKKEINLILNRMKKICDTLHERNMKPK